MQSVLQFSSFDSHVNKNHWGVDTELLHSLIEKDTPTSWQKLQSAESQMACSWVKPTEVMIVAP